MQVDQIRGLLLEEAVMHLLRSSGYMPISTRGADNTLEQEGNTLFVKGRGGRHQIDAIADYRVQAPFTNPQRLLVEAKFYDGRRVGLIVIRNAVGVLHDVSQFFLTGPGNPIGKPRYHYQYAVVSATKFTNPSQRYAYAHDVFLIPLGESLFFRNLLNTIRNVAELLAPVSRSQDAQEFSGRLRSSIRSRLDISGVDDVEAGVYSVDEMYPDEVEYSGRIDTFVRACRDIGFGIIAVTSSGFPLFLTPTEGLRIEDLIGRITVRIFRSEAGWILRNLNNEDLFSFDIPSELMSLYAEGGDLTSQRTLDLKQQEMHKLDAVITDGNLLRIIQFRLDMPWMTAIREASDSNQVTRPS